MRANELLELANRALEDGDVDGAKALYEQSCLVKETATAWFNLGVSVGRSKPTTTARTGGWCPGASVERIWNVVVQREWMETE